MRAWLLTLCWLVLAGCSSVEVVLPPAEAVLSDALFAPPSEPVGADELFALTPEMRRYVEARLSSAALRTRPQQALIEALYTRGELRLQYDSTRTRNAREAFEARAGNCLSLVIMTAAFAKDLNLAVRFQAVDETTVFERNGDVVFAVGHVNLALGQRPWSGQSRGDPVTWLVVDFLPGQDLPRLQTHDVDERRIRAMYMNNRAAEALAQGRIADAYWWARAALQEDRRYANIYNTLGVIFQRRGALPQAERALRAALALQSDSPQVLGNLVGTLQSLGRAEEAQALRARLQRLEPTPPYAWFDRGMQALHDGDFRLARSLFARELERAPYNAEFHHWMAVACFELGDTARARRHLELATENSTTRELNARYASKLAWLKSRASH